GPVMQVSAVAERASAGAMRAAVVTAPGEASLERVAVPEPGAGEVRIRLEGTGVCASNLAAWQGQPWFEYPFDPGGMGHEGWGRIDAVGEGVSTIVEGQRVATLSNRAYAEFDIAPADQVVPLPASLDGRAFPGEPLGC